MLCYPPFSSDELCVTFFLAAKLSDSWDKKKFRGRYWRKFFCFIVGWVVY